MKGALLVAGTTSDAGKSVLVAGLCRWLRRQGVSVAPFKAQNMSLNSFVTPAGAEIGRAQAMQAAAAGIEPDARMNPVLLKPGATGSQVVLLGHPAGDVDALSYQSRKARLLEVALDSLGQLRSEFDVVVCEGAGSPAEINLRATDIANMGLARAAGLPVLVVTDIDRGGSFAALYGTVALLEPADQALIAGFVINKFRGARALLDPGLGMISGLTGRPVLGVLPWAPGLWLDAEDSLALDAARPAPAGPPHGGDVLRVSVVRLPRISNFTDIDALAAEPGVLVRMAASPAELADADLVVLPGSRATVADLGWLRAHGFAEVIAERARKGQPVLGICGGYQVLGTQIEDDVESRAGTVGGLGLLPVSVRFGAEKRLGRPSGSAYGAPVIGYEIHHGIVTPLDARPDGVGRGGVGPGGVGPGDAGSRGARRGGVGPGGTGSGGTGSGGTGSGAAFPSSAEPFLDGCRVGSVWGTSWHGTLENDSFRRAFLTEVAALTGRDFKPAPDTCFAALREAQLDLLGDLVADHLDTGAVSRLIEDGAPAGLPVIPPAGVAGLTDS